MALRDLWPSRPRRDRDEPPPGPELAAALADLERLAAARPDLEGPGRTLAAVLRAAFSGWTAGRPEAPAHADPALIVAAWRAGVPAFRAGDRPPRLDPDDLRARGAAVCAAVADDHPGAGVLRAAILDGRADLHAWALEALADGPEAVVGRAGALGLDPALARSVLRLALLPPLAGLSAGLAGLRPEGAWAGPGCPNCGEPPALGESRGLEQRRYWRCGLCAGDWPGDRLRCPLCGETDHRRLRSLFVEGEEDRERLAVCDACGGSLPVVSTLGPLTAPGLLVAELTTARLVLLAADGPPPGAGAP